MNRSKKLFVAQITKKAVLGVLIFMLSGGAFLVPAKGVNTQETEPPVPVLTTVVVSPAVAALTVGQTQIFNVSLLDQFDNQIEGEVIWSVDNEEIASINPTGTSTVEFIAENIPENQPKAVVTVTASSGDKNGTAIVTALNPLPMLDSIIVSPESETMVIGETKNFAATALDQFGQPLQIQPEFIWQSAVPETGAINATTGEFTALTQGATTITAQSGELFGSAVATVVPPEPTLAKVRITPGTRAVAIGNSFIFEAQALDQFGNPISPQPIFEWANLNPNQGVIDGTTGLFTAQKEGTAVITAAVGAVSGSATAIITADSRSYDACNGAGRIVRYNVAAIDVPIPVNGWGDINPQGMMYGLDHPEAVPNVEQIKDPNFKLYDTTDESIPKKIQPLVLRANVGDCVEINLANKLDIVFGGINPNGELIDPHTNRRNVGMEIMGMPYDPETSAGGFAGNNPDTTVAPGQSKVFRWYASRAGGYMFRDNSNIQFPQDTIVKGLFGMVIVEPANSTWRDSITGRNFLKSNPQNSYHYTDLASIGNDGAGRNVYLGVGASIFSDVHQPAGAPLPKSVLSWETVSGNDYRSYGIIMHDEPEGMLGPVAWNQDGTVAAFGKPFFPATGIGDDTFLMNYRSEPLRNREGAWERHRGLIPVPGIGLVDGAKNQTIELPGDPATPGHPATAGTRVTVNAPMVEIEMAELGDRKIVIDSSKVVVRLPNGREFQPGDDFCNGKNDKSDNSPEGPAYNFYECVGEEAHLQSWPFGDPAVAMPRAYWGDPVVFYVGNADSHDSHTFHQHTHRWLHNPDNADITNLPVPENPMQKSNRLDVQGVGAGEVYKLVYEQGAGSVTGTAGDSIFHCHLYPHFAGGIWSALRVFDKLRINFDDPSSIKSTLGDGSPLYYPDGTDIAVLQPLPARVALFNTADPDAVDNRASPPAGMANRVPGIPDQEHPGFPNFVAGKFGMKALQPPLFVVEPETGQPIKDRAEPTELEINASYDGLRPGATLVDPCKGVNGEFGANRKPDRIYQPVAIQVPFVQNGKGGFFNPEQRAYVEKELVDDVRRDPTLLQPYSFRANVGDCVEVRSTNDLQPDDRTPTLGTHDGIYRGPTNTTEISQHVHPVRFDQLGTDGTSVGWNYDISQRAGETAAYRWFVDVNVRTVFSHDHQFPTSHQQGGLWSAFINEPSNSILQNPETGEPLGPTINAETYEQTSGKYPREQVKGVGVKADVIVAEQTSGQLADITGGLSSGNIKAFREFVVQYSDFTPAFVADPAALKEAMDELKTGKLNENPFRSDLKIYDPALRTKPVEPPIKINDYLQDQGISTLNYRVEPFQARVNPLDPNATAAMKEPAYVYSSVIHGDPETAVFRAYYRDPVVIRFMDGAHEEHHTFDIHGHRWLHEASDPNSFLTDNQASNIGEWFNYELSGNNFIRNKTAGSSLTTAAGSPGDYIFGSKAMNEKFSGMWGLFRVENGEKENLIPLPNNPAPPFIDGLGLLEQVVSPTGTVPVVTEDLTQDNSPCPNGAPVKRFNIFAIQKSVTYNSRFGENDPFGLMYVLEEEKESVQKGRKPAEPLVMRANEGDCIEVKLTNELPDLTELAENTNAVFPGGTFSPTSLDPNTLQHYGDAQVAGIVEGLPFGGVHLGAPEPELNRIFAKWPMSQRVSLHPHLLKEVASVGDGATAGFMRDQTVGPGESITYIWYADKALGVTLLDDFGDERSHKHHGLYAALVIEPNDSVYLDPATGKKIKSGTNAVIHNKKSNEHFREFVSIFSDGLNLRKENTIIPDESGPVHPGEIGHVPCSPPGALCEDVEAQGEGGINYRTERLANRTPLAGDNEIDFNPLAYTVFSSNVHGDPATPVFESFAGDPTVIRVARASDVGKVITIGVGGHVWPHEPEDSGTNIVNSEGSFGVGKAMNFELMGGSGGEKQMPGDYLISDRNHIEPGHTVQGGHWGILRVRPAGESSDFIKPLDRLLAPIPDQIHIAPPARIIIEGETYQFTAHIFDQFDDVIENAVLNWSSSNPSVGAIDSQGIFIAVSAGTTTISASIGSANATIEVVVTEAPAAPVIPVQTPPSLGGGGGSVIIQPSPPTGSIIINNGAETANNVSVLLTLKAPGATSMAISNDSDFSGTIFEEYKETRSWNIEPGEGAKTVYAKFRNTEGNTSELVSDSIMFLNIPSEPAPSPSPEPGKILGVARFNFTKNLFLGIRHNDVLELKKRLREEGLYKGKMTDLFGMASRAAVKAFQKKYGIGSATGFVGPKTRKKLNATLQK